MSHTARFAGSLFGALVATTLIWPANGAPPNRMLGPNFPALVDTKGNGKPTEGSDVKVVPSRSGNLVSIPNPWDVCAGGGNANNQLIYSTPDSKGKFTTIAGGRKDGGGQTASITGFDTNGRPTSFSGIYTRPAPGGGTFRGTGAGNFTGGTGGIPTGFHLTVSAAVTTNYDANFVYADVDGDGNPDYMSVPFATQSALGVKPFPCAVPGAGTGNPQIWIPMGDSNGDGIPDGIVWDLDGNGVPDADVYQLPPMVASPCVYAVSPGTRTAPAAGESNSFAITTGNASCIWTATSNASWLVPTSTGTGNGSVAYTVAANTGLVSRTGVITVNGQTFTVTQAAAAITCTYSIAPTSFSAAAAGGSSTFALTASDASCAWTATTSSSFLTVNTPSGTGSGTIGFTVAANPSTSSRTGTISAGGQTFTVTQAAAAIACTYSIDPTSFSAAAAGGSSTFALTASDASCAWTAATSSSFLTVNTPSGTGSGTIGFTVAANTSTSSRTGTISAGGQTFTVTQGGNCTFTFNPSTVNIPAAGGSFSSALTASDQSCAWTATTTASFITITASREALAASGTGNGTVTFTVAANTGAARSGTVTVGSQTFTVSQAAVAVAPVTDIPTLSEWALIALGVSLAAAGWAFLRKGGLGV